MIWTVINVSLIEMSLTASLMIVSALLIRTLIKSRIPWFSYVLIWYMVILRLLIPFKFTVNLSLPADKILYSFVQSDALEPLLTGSPRVINMIVPNTEAVSNLFLPMKYIWLTGVLFLSAYFLFIYIRWSLKFKAGIEITDLVEVSNEFNTVRKVKVYKCSNLSSPLTYGTIYPKIFIPDNMDISDLNTLRYVVCHEYIHIKRFDSLTKLLIISALCLHWFNPMVWIFFIFANRDLEISCDEAVIKKFGIERSKEYALALIKMEEIKADKSVSLHSCFNTNIVKERIVKIMKAKKKSKISKALAFIIVAANAVIFSPVIISAHELKNGILIETEPAFIWPAGSCKVVTGKYGENELNKTFHNHIDISGDNAEGSAVFASASGIIEEAGYDTINGNYIIINHGNGYKTFYSHCQELNVNVNDTVNQGDTIATIGKTGSVTGYCLAFGIINNGDYINPLDLL